MALRKCSAGSCLASARNGLHQIKAPITPTLLSALIQNGAASPATPMMMPASAGPTARLMLIPTLLSATAGGSSSRGTSCGTIACHAGAISAAPAPTRNVKARSSAGVTSPRPTTSANPAVSRVSATCTAISRRRRSRMSASAPAGSPRRKIGSVVATWTRATVSGSGSRPVISQPAAAFCSQVPMLETTVATHRMAKTLCRNGLHDDPPVAALLVAVWACPVDVVCPAGMCASEGKAGAAERAPEGSSRASWPAAVSRLLHAPPNPGTHSDGGHEYPGEMALIREATGKRDVGDRTFGFEQELRGLVDSLCEQPTMRRRACSPLETSCEVTAGESAFICQLGDGQ